MQRMSRLLGLGGILLIVLFLVSSPADSKGGYKNGGVSREGEEEPWTFLNTTAIGAYQFLREHPTYDGRGVVIIICDTGVDMDVPGLQTTSTGEVKVIDAQDFSGQGDVSISEAELGEEGGEKFAQDKDGRKLFHYDRLPLKPADGTYWIGFLEERRFQNSRVKDINNNGRRDDRFGVLTFKVAEGDEEYWVAFVDTDADGSVEDEQPLRDYKVQQQAFHLRGRDKEKSKDLMTFALNIRPEDRVVSFHYADHPHGTHVAGIAAGYRIYDQEHLNGIAPGAKIISLKIGNCTYSGGATTTGSMRKAFEYGIDYAQSHRDTPVIFNLSYGIGSEIEGQSEIEAFLNDLLEENENVVICVSAGNEGPGISSIGNPASASRVISVGAMFPPSSARDSYGAIIDRMIIFPFSSRGGEVAKPDVVAPGAASSSVPNYSRRENFWGTSMASPQVAGASALLLSAALQQDPPLKWSGSLIKKALKNSAREIPGYTPLDQGSGLINVPRAFEVLKRLARGKEPRVDYEISTESPFLPDYEGPAAYWRTGGYFPRGTDRQVFRVRAIFPRDTDADTKARFYRAFDLRSTADWLIVEKQSTYIRGEGWATIPVRYERKKLRNPGLYVAKVVAYRKGGAATPRSRSKVEFELLNTVIIPYTFDERNEYRRTLKGGRLRPGDLDRHFFLVPPGATTFDIAVSPAPGKWCQVMTEIFDPEGHTYAEIGPTDSRSPTPQRISIPKRHLMPGIWEVVVFADFRNKADSYYDLQVGFSGIVSDPEVITSLDFEPGDRPQGNIWLTNLFNKPFYGRAKGFLQGYQKTLDEEIQDDDSFYYDFAVDSNIEKVVFELELPKKSFNKFTDIAVNVEDSEGKYLVQDAMVYRKNRLVFYPIEEGAYTYQVKGALTYSKSGSRWHLRLKVYFYLKEKIAVSMSHKGRYVFHLYPGLRTQLHYEFEESPPIAPKGHSYFGQILLKDRYTGVIQGSIPILFQTEAKE